MPTSENSAGQLAEATPIREVVGFIATDASGNAVPVLPVRYVDSVISTDETGHPVDAMPVVVEAGLISGGRPVVPVRVVAGLVTTNEIGSNVPVVPVFMVGRPAVVVPPHITGTPEDGSNAILHVGEWIGLIDHFDAAWYNAADNSVLVARATVTSASSIPVGTVGQTIYAIVWAVTESGVSSAPAQTANFGPITTAGDTLIFATAWSRSVESLPAGWTAIDCDDSTGFVPAGALWPQTNPAHAGLRWGFGGSQAATATVTAVTTTGDNGRLRGRRTDNLQPANCYFAIEVPDVNAVYRVYGAFRHGTTTVAGNQAIRDGSAAGSELYALSNAVTHTSTQVKDIAGNVTDIATWAAASPAGGQFVEVTPVVDTGSGKAILIFCRPTTGGAASQMNCLAVYKKAV